MKVHSLKLFGEFSLGATDLVLISFMKPDVRKTLNENGTSWNVWAKFNYDETDKHL